MNRAGGEEAVELKGVDACCIVQSSVLREYVRNLIGSQPADVARRDVRLSECRI